MILNPKTPPQRPQLAAIELLVHAVETAVVALSAAHPNIEHDLRNDPLPPIDKLADCAVDRAIDMLDALDRYRRSVHDLDRIHRETHLEDDTIF